MKRTLLSIAFASTLALTGCGEKKQPGNYQEGKVIGEYGTLVKGLEKNPEFDGLLSYSNETVRVGEPIYGIRVETQNGIYTIDFDDKAGSPGPRTVNNLAAAIEEGITVRFPTTNVPHNIGQSPTGFSSDRLGTLDPDDIELVNDK
jgi:hypothetical protein